MYNRWLSDDELMHSGRVGMKWGVRNGPPYPLSRQARFRSSGGKVTKDNYLRVSGGGVGGKTRKEKSEHQKDVTRSRAERKANPNKGGQDAKEKNSLIAKVKRAYRQHKKENEEYEKKYEAAEKKDAALEKRQMKRMDKLGLTPKEREQIMNEVYGKKGHSIEGMRWGARDGSQEKSSEADFDGNYLDGFKDTTEIDRPYGERLKYALDKYESNKKAKEAKFKQDRDAAVDHGTAEEVMKFRESITTEEWESISRRLQAEETVKKFLDKPVSTPSSNDNNKGNKNNQNKNDSTSEFKDLENPKFQNVKNMTDKERLYRTGDARTIYKNRDKFTTDELSQIAKRLEAEKVIGNYADQQVNLDSDRIRKFKKAVEVLGTVSSAAKSTKEIINFFAGGSKNNNNNNNNGGGGGGKNGGGGGVMNGLFNVYNTASNADSHNMATNYTATYNDNNGSSQKEDKKQKKK